MKEAMSDRKPYLLRAMYEWIVDNGCTPHLMIAHPGSGWVSGVPEKTLKEDLLVLNISPSAAPDCVIEENGVYFSTRFNGRLCSVTVAMAAIASIFARETQEGMRFELPDDLAEGPKTAATSAQAESTEKRQNRPDHLKIVK